MRGTTFLFPVLACCLLMAGCNAPGSASGLRGGSKAGSWPFVPTSMRIYPLTHVERGERTEGAEKAKGEGKIIAHIDFRDAWGDSTKAIGTLTIFLYGPNGRGALAQTQPNDDSTQQRRYDIDLTDLRRNAELFDPATRTYRIPLAGLPVWALSTDPFPRMTLRAEMQSVRPEGGTVLMVDEYVITR